MILNDESFADVRDDKNVSPTSPALSKPGMKSLPDDFEPSEFDVICAKGKDAYNHEGNKRLRNMIRAHLDMYSKAKSRVEKSSIVSRIVDSVRDASPEGGFVRFSQGRWNEVGEAVARDKVGQSFRDSLHTKYRSSTKAKRRRQQENSKVQQLQLQQQEQHEQEQASVQQHLVAPSAGTSAIPAEVNWSRFLELYEFKQHHGHCRVPATYAGGLGEWMRGIRSLQRSGRLNKAQEEHLNTLGVEWALPTSQQQQFVPLPRVSDETSSICSSTTVGSSSAGSEPSSRDDGARRNADYLQSSTAGLAAAASLLNGVPRRPRVALPAVPTTTTRVEQPLVAPPQSLHSQQRAPTVSDLATADLTTLKAIQIARARAQARVLAELSVARALILAQL